MKSGRLQNCNKCGLCLSVCPTYKTLLQEHASPRARLQLIKYYDSNALISSPGLQEVISKCLMCGACAAICPSGINHYSKFMEMRTRMAREHGEKIVIKSLVYLLASEFRTKFAAGFAKVGQKIMPQGFSKKYNLGNIPLKRLPQFNQKPFRQTAAETGKPAPGEKGSVLYFTGCATNYLFDKTGIATIHILKRMGYQVIIPENQTCCGIPMLFHGAGKAAEKNILTNIKCLNPDRFTHDNIKAVIVDCPTCGTALKNEYPALKDQFNSKTAEIIGKISSKVIDIMSFVLQESGSTNLAQNLETLKPDDLKHESRKNQKRLKEMESQKIKVTYHLPCHLKNSLQSLGNSETVLKNIEGLDYTRAVDVDECCGGGGTFFYEYPEVSREMVKGKIENAKKTGARIWLTDCPVCRINLSGNLKEDDNLMVKHPVEMIAP